MATTFFPSRFYFWRSLANSKADPNPSGPAQTVGDLFKTSKPYMDLGGSGLIVSLCRPLPTSGLTDSVVCFDLRLNDEFDLAKTLSDRIHSLGGTGVEAHCTMEGGPAVCQPLGLSVQASEAGSESGRSLFRNLGDFISNNSDQLAEICGNIKVISVSKDGREQQVAVPLGRLSASAGALHAADFYVGTVSPSAFQGRTSFYAIGSIVLCTILFGCLIVMFGDSVIKRREMTAAFQKVGIVMKDAPTPYVRLDAEDKLVDCNFSFCRLLGLPANAQGVQSVTNRKFASFCEEDDASRWTYTDVQKKRSAGENVVPYILTLTSEVGNSVQVRVVSADIPSAKPGSKGLPETFGILLEPKIAKPATILNISGGTQPV